MGHPKVYNAVRVIIMTYKGNCFADIPKIIAEPDYISVHPKDKSISFIKNYSGHVSVAVRIAPNGNMAYRTMYPITDAQLSHYIAKGFAWKYK